VHSTRAAFQPAGNNCCGHYKELDNHDLDLDFFTLNLFIISWGSFVASNKKQLGICVL